MVIDGTSIYSGCKIYITINYNQGFRKTACIYKNNRHVKSIGYAKYLMEVYTNSHIPEGYEVDHINADCTDDRIENLQIITKEMNILKDIYDSYKFKTYVRLICPWCGKQFDCENHDFVTKVKYFKYVSCSRSCSGKLTNKSMCIDISGTPLRPYYEYKVGYFKDICEILETERILDMNGVKYIKKYR